MTAWGSFNFAEFERLGRSLQGVLDEQVVDRFIREFLTEMAMRSLRKIKKRTPVGVYSNVVRFTTSAGREVHFTTSSQGRVGGHLRRTWQVGVIERRGDAYIIEIFNNTDYAVYVEYGHRTGRDLTKWVNGKFMMTISMQEMERELPIYLERRQMKLLEQIMNGRLPRG